MITATYTGSYGHKHTVKVDHLVNRGAWWGETWILEIGCGYFSFFFVIEADHESDAIDEFADCKYSHLIDVDERDCPQTEEEEDHTDYCRAGNDGHWVDLSYCALHRCKVNYFAPPEDTRKMFVRISSERGVSIFLPDDHNAPSRDFPDMRAYRVVSWYAPPSYAMRQETGYNWIEYPNLSDSRYSYIHASQR